MATTGAAVHRGSFPVLLVLVFLMGAQFYYPFGLQVVLFAAGCVPAATWLAHRRGWRIAMVVGIAVNAAVSLLIALPLVPLHTLSDTPIPGINQVAQDSIGWPRYVGQIAAVYARRAVGRATCHDRLREQLRRSRCGRPVRRAIRAAPRLQRAERAALRGGTAQCRDDGRVRRRPVRRCARRSFGPARSRRTWTTVSASTTRSRTSRSPSVVIRSAAGAALGRSWPTWTDAAQCPEMSSKPTMWVGCSRMSSSPSTALRRPYSSARSAPM